MDLDPRWEWFEAHRFGDAEPRYIRGRCLHTEVVDVCRSLDGERVAQLCLTCDAQLPPRYDA